LLPRSTRAFPVIQAGRRPRLHFRGLLRLHSRYGLPDCSTAQGGLCHEASARQVTPTSRSSATRSYRQLPGWILPPLVNRAFGAHVESRTGAVVQAIRHHPVSRPRSSNAACGFPALRSPTGFTAKHTTRPVFARDWAADAVFALRHSSFRRLLALQVFYRLSPITMP
jgi:hypothetical protein